MPKKLLLIIALAIAGAGIAYLITGLFYVPDLAQFEVTGELAKTEYRARESITVEPFLTYTGMRRQVTIYAGTPLFFVEVYTAENERALELPVLDWVLISDFLWSHTLRPNVPYNEKDGWGRGILGWPAGHPYESNILDYVGAYSFRLEQAGSYKVVVRAEFIVGEDVTSKSAVYSGPIWVQITG